jgi:hypothetical protein
MDLAKFGFLEHPAFLTGHLIHRLGLVDFHHSHGRAVSRVAADGTEVGLGGVLNRHAWRLWLLALFPTNKLLAADQRDQQGEHGKQALLDVQWRDTQLGGTLAIHPETPPTLVVIWLRAFIP